jgi:hypothetical protein
METSFKIQDMQNPSVLTLISRVMKAASRLTSDKIIIEEVGYGLNQLAWRDETWDYVRFRATPIWVSRRLDRRTAVAEDFMTALREELHASDLSLVVDDDEPESRMVVRWGKTSHKIGD